jgi:hypothetical protein
METMTSLTNTLLEPIQTPPLLLDLSLPPTLLQHSAKCPSTPPLGSRQMVPPHVTLR